jgi:hypothetical protein
MPGLHQAPDVVRNTIVECVTMRSIAIFSYLFIFLPSSMILLPFGCLLVSGLFTAEPLIRFLLFLADVALVTLLVCSSKPYSKTRLIIEVGAFFLLILPLLLLLISFSLEWFNYWLFWLPVGVFIVVFPVSIYQNYRKR